MALRQYSQTELKKCSEYRKKIAAMTDKEWKEEWLRVTEPFKKASKLKELMKEFDK